MSAVLPSWAYDLAHGITPAPGTAPEALARLGPCPAPPPADLTPEQVAAGVAEARAAHAALVAEFAAHPPPLRKEPAPPKVIPLRRGAHPIALQWAKERGYVLANYGGELAELAFKDCPPEWRDALTAGRGEGRR